VNLFFKVQFFSQYLKINTINTKSFGFCACLAVAPNLTILVRELVSARLISHAGSLLNLAKHPSSTI